MALTRLKNVFTSRTGRCLYVNPDDFDASDSFDNRGNSPNRPFKSIQRALLEASRFSYRTGQYNDAFESFTIVLYPGEYVIDNRPGRNVSNQAFLPSDISVLSSSTNFDLQNADGSPNPNNVLYRFNSVEGGVIVPRGTSLVGMDLRKTKIRPLYVPDPTAGGIDRSAIWRVTGGCYFWQFSFFDGPKSGVYSDPQQPSASTPPSYSHHKLTCFEYADGKNVQSSINGTDGNPLIVTDLDLYYQKVAKAFADIPDTTGVLTADELQARVEENRIVGPNTSGPISITSVVTDFVSSNVFTTTAEVTTATPHGFSVGTPVLVEGVTGTDATRFNGSFFISEIPTTTTFRYVIKDPGTGAPSGNPTATGATVKVEIDNVDSASPYIFNISLRSTWGICGMHADGAKATGFKSMVVAQFTGVSLQKDDNAFIKWDGANYIAGGHTDGDAIYKATYRNFHIKCSNDSVIQAVSVFAVGFADHFVALSGGDQSITNSNSNFGSVALRAKGYKALPFTQDKAGTITHIVPPKKLDRTYNVVTSYTFAATQNNVTVTPTPANASHGIAVGDYVRFVAIDAQESYKVTAVNPTSGVLTLNRGYRGSTGGTITVYKGTINEIPVGYVALDVQKIQYQASAGNKTWSASASFNAPGGEHSCIYNGNAYYSAQLAAATQSTQAGNTPPTHTSGTATDGIITWSYVGPVDTRLYLYGYTSQATKPPYKLQGFNIGARKQDVVYVTLIDSSNASTPTIHAALITPDGSASPADSAFTAVTEQQFIPGDPNHPLQFDAELSNWYLRVTAATSGSSSVSGTTGYAGIHEHLATDSFYINSLFTGAGFLRRVPDNRSSRDRTYRVRYVVDSAAATLQRDPINGYIIQTRNVPTGQSYSQTYYIYDIEKAQELIKGVQNGIYYMTVVNGSISPTDSNVSSFGFSQNINDLYPTLDKDNPTEDPGEATSVASNVTIGLVTTTDGASNEAKELSITKEVIADFITESRNNYTNYSTSNPATANFITLEARDGEAEELDRDLRMIPVNSTGGTETELRRPSILRSGNHTFEYVGFGPGNYSTGLPSVQNRVLTDEEVLLAQSQKEEGGIAFYSGLNSNGDLFIGNTKISSVTGEEANLDTPTLSIVGETANLRPTFDEIIVRDKITVESQTLESDFKGKLLVRGETTVQNTLTANDITVGGASESQKNIDVVAATPSVTNAANTGDWKLLENITRGQYLGWYWTGAEWVKFGLSDTGNMAVSGGSGATDATGDLQLKNGLGLDIQSTGTLNVNSGATTLGGSLSVTGISTLTGNVTLTGDLAVNGGDLTTTATTFNLINSTATTVNLANAATTMTVGATTGTLTLRNATTAVSGVLNVTGNLNVNTNKFNVTASNGNVTMAGDLTVSGGDLTVGSSNVVSDSSGTATLKNIDALDATTEATIEAAIDTLANLTSASSLATVGTIGTGTWQASIIARNYGGTGIDSSTLSNGQLLIGGSSGFSKATLSSSTGISITNGNGTITINNTGVQSFAVGTGWYGTSVNSATGAVTLTVGSSSNAYGRRYVSTGNPSGGSDGDIWYKY